MAIHVLSRDHQLSILLLRPLFSQCMYDVAYPPSYPPPYVSLNSLRYNATITTFLEKGLYEPEKLSQSWTNFKRVIKQGKQCNRAMAKDWQTFVWGCGLSCFRKSKADPTKPEGNFERTQKYLHLHCRFSLSPIIARLRESCMKIYNVKMVDTKVA